MKILFSAVFLGINPAKKKKLPKNDQCPLVTSFLHCPYPQACAETHFWTLAHCDVTKEHWRIIMYIHQVSDEFVSPSEFTLHYFLSSSEGGPRIPAVFCASTAVLVFFWHFLSFHSTSAQPHRTNLAFESSALFLDPIVQGLILQPKKTTKSTEQVRPASKTVINHIMSLTVNGKCNLPSTLTDPQILNGGFKHCKTVTTGPTCWILSNWSGIRPSVCNSLTWKMKKSHFPFQNFKHFSTLSMQPSWWELPKEVQVIK